MSKNHRSIYKFGTVNAYVGPMFSGKTANILRDIFKYKKSNMKFLLVKWKKDDRNVLKVSTHDYMSYDGDIMCLENLDELLGLENLAELNGIFIDEGQFFNDLKETIFTLHLRYPWLNITVSCLYTKWSGEVFNNVQNFLSICDGDIVFMKTICDLCCSDNALFNSRKTSNENDIAIGGRDLYYALCFRCFNTVYLCEETPENLWKCNSCEVSCYYKPNYFDENGKSLCQYCGFKK